MSKTRIILLRHGHVEGICPPAFRGHQDLRLTDVGRAQAALACRYIDRRENISMIYASPLSRCRDTAAIIGVPRDIEPIPLAGLMDIDYGAWQGRAHEAVKREDPERFDGWFKRPDRTTIPGGESLQQVAERISPILTTLRERHQGETIVAVGHDSVNRIVLLMVLGLPLSYYWCFHQHPCGLNIIDFDGSRFVVDCINESGYLKT